MRQAPRPGALHRIVAEGSIDHKERIRGCIAKDVGLEDGFKDEAAPWRAGFEHDRCPGHRAHEITGTQRPACPAAGIGVGGWPDDHRLVCELVFSFLPLGLGHVVRSGLVDPAPVASGERARLRWQLAARG